MIRFKEFRWCVFSSIIFTEAPSSFQSEKILTAFIWKFSIRSFPFFRFECAPMKQLWSRRFFRSLCIDSSKIVCRCFQAERIELLFCFSSRLLISEFIRTLIEHFIRQTDCPRSFADFSEDSSINENGSLMKLGQTVASKSKGNFDERKSLTTVFSSRRILVGFHFRFDFVGFRNEKFQSFRISDWSSSSSSGQSKSPHSAHSQ